MNENYLIVHCDCPWPGGNLATHLRDPAFSETSPCVSDYTVSHHGACVCEL